MKIRDWPSMLFIVLLIDMLIVVLHLSLSQHTYLGTLFDLDKEANFPTWYTSFKLTLAGVVAFFIYGKETKSTKTYTRIWFWLVIGLLMFFMSVDETAQIHETLTRWFMQTLAGGRLLYTLEIGKTGGTLVWGLIFSPLLIMIAATLLLFYVDRFKQKRLLALLSMLMLSLFVGSFLLEYQEAHIAGQLTDITLEQLQSYQLMTLIEETCELFATSLLLFIHFYYYRDSEFN